MATIARTHQCRFVRRYPYQAVIGYRFTGMAIHRPYGTSQVCAPGAGDAGSVDAAAARDRCTGGDGGQATSPALPKCYVRFGRDYGWSLAPDTAREGFRQFLFDGRRVRVELIPPLLARLRRLRVWMARQRLYRFYSSSLLLVYDGAPDRGSDLPRVVVRMIDFAHAIPRPLHHRDPTPPAACSSFGAASTACGGDCCYVHGLLRMEEALESLLMEQEDYRTPPASS